MLDNIYHIGFLLRTKIMSLVSSADIETFWPIEGDQVQQIEWRVKDIVTLNTVILPQAAALDEHHLEMHVPKDLVL